MIDFHLKLKKRKNIPINKFLAYRKVRTHVDAKHNWHMLIFIFFVGLTILVFTSVYFYSFFFSMPTSGEDTRDLFNGVSKEKMTNIIRLFDEKKKLFDEYITTPPAVIDPSL